MPSLRMAIKYRDTVSDLGHPPMQTVARKEALEARSDSSVPFLHAVASTHGLGSSWTSSTAQNSCPSCSGLLSGNDVPLQRLSLQDTPHATSGSLAAPPAWGAVPLVPTPLFPGTSKHSEGKINK